MVMMGGRERTAAELEALLATSGLRPERIVSLPTPDKLVEAMPASRPAARCSHNSCRGQTLRV
jgi:hypothetical protein